MVQRSKGTILFYFWERLNVGSLPTVKMHPVGSLPTVKMHPVGSLPTVKMQPVGSVLLLKCTIFDSRKGLFAPCRDPCVFSYRGTFS